MPVTNKMLMEEIERLQVNINELRASVSLVCERMASIEAWRNGHDKNVHPHISQQITASQRVQERQGDRLWGVALQVANLGALVAAVTKMGGLW